MGQKKMLKIFLFAKHIFGSKLSLTNIFLDHIFWTKLIFDNFSNDNFFPDGHLMKFLGTIIFSDQNIFFRSKFCWTKFFWEHNISGPTSFWD